MNEGMTDKQFNIMMKLIIEVIKGCESKEEAVKKIEALMKQPRLQSTNKYGGACHRRTPNTLYHVIGRKARARGDEKRTKKRRWGDLQTIRNRTS